MKTRKAETARSKKGVKQRPFSTCYNRREKINNSRELGKASGEKKPRLESAMGIRKKDNRDKSSCDNSGGGLPDREMTKRDRGGGESTKSAQWYWKKLFPNTGHYQHCR